jgi:hypothetical protein
LAETLTGLNRPDRSRRFGILIEWGKSMTGEMDRSVAVRELAIGLSTLEAHDRTCYFNALGEIAQSITDQEHRMEVIEWVNWCVSPEALQRQDAIERYYLCIVARKAGSGILAVTWRTTGTIFSKD